MRFNSTPMIIELKQTSPSIAKPLCDMLKAQRMQSRVIVGAFTIEPLTEFREACPDFATGMAQSEVVSLLALQLIGLEHWHSSPAVALQLPPEQYGIPILRKGFIAAAQQRGYLVQAWTINEQDAIESMLNLGVDGVISDYPNRVAIALAKQ